MSFTGFTDTDVPDQSGKCFVVTGANTGIGFEASRDGTRLSTAAEVGFLEGERSGVGLLPLGRECWDDFAVRFAWCRVGAERERASRRRIAATCVGACGERRERECSESVIETGR